jgi:hypothetical protein
MQDTVDQLRHLLENCFSGHPGGGLVRLYLQGESLLNTEYPIQLVVTYSPSRSVQTPLLTGLWDDGQWLTVTFTGGFSFEDFGTLEATLIRWAELVRRAAVGGLELFVNRRHGRVVSGFVRDRSTGARVASYADLLGFLRGDSETAVVGPGIDQEWAVEVAAIANVMDAQRS